MTTDRAVFPSPGFVNQIDQPVQRSQGLIRPNSLYHQPDVRSIQSLGNTTGKMPQRLRFAAPGEISHEYEPITLPKIEPYVPAGTDPDSATALTALYRSHCTSLVECIRFCKEKTFFHLFTSFHGTLTMPVQKLFANPAIAPWIEECDFVMYQKMMRVVAPLTLQVAPKPVLDTLRNISERLVPHIQDSFQGHPHHVIQAKIAPATLFAGLLDRELRVNLTAHAAANMLSNPANRDQMYEDWITMVRPRKVAECVPTRGMDDVVMLLLSEMRDLLDPTAIPWEIEAPTIYGEMALRNGRSQQANIHAESTTENVLDRWVAFLTLLPSRFPYASHAEIVWCVQRVGTAAMRDLTLQQGQSFGAWWVTKCWLDEMVSFMAEQGGFMEYKTSKLSHREASAAQQSAQQRGNSHGTGRYNSSENFSGRPIQANGGVVVSGPHADGNGGTLDAVSQGAMNAAAGHDDSGISMRTPEEEFAMSKFGFVGGEVGLGVGTTELHTHGLP
jgi:regulatory factor X